MQELRDLKHEWIEMRSWLDAEGFHRLFGCPLCPPGLNRVSTVGEGLIDFSCDPNFKHHHCYSGASGGKQPIGREPFK